jgi:type II secretion system protein G
MKRDKKGFTLIELLVVIAIIGILATIVLVSLNTARQKARDVRRIADMRQIALALEMYYDDNPLGYPGGTNLANCIASEWTTMEGVIEGGGYMTSVPSDPGGGSVVYGYDMWNNGAEYVLRADLEQLTNTALNTDVDGVAGGVGGCDCADTNGYYCIQP